MRNLLLLNTNKNTDQALEDDGEIVGSSVQFGTFALRRWDPIYDEIPSQISEYDRNGDIIWKIANPENIAKGHSAEFEADLGTTGWKVRLRPSAQALAPLKLWLVDGDRCASVSGRIVTRLYWRVHKRLDPAPVVFLHAFDDDYRKQQEEILREGLVALSNLKA